MENMAELIDDKGTACLLDQLRDFRVFEKALNRRDSTQRVREGFFHSPNFITEPVSRQLSR